MLAYIVTHFDKNHLGHGCRVVGRCRRCRGLSGLSRGGVLTTVRHGPFAVAVSGGRDCVGWCLGVGCRDCRGCRATLGLLSGRGCRVVGPGLNCLVVIARGARGENLGLSLRKWRRPLRAKLAKVRRPSGLNLRKWVSSWRSAKAAKVEHLPDPYFPPEPGNQDAGMSISITPCDLKTL